MIRTRVRSGPCRCQPERSNLVTDDFATRKVPSAISPLTPVGVCVCVCVW